MKNRRIVTTDAAKTAAVVNDPLVLKKGKRIGLADIQLMYREGKAGYDLANGQLCFSKEMRNQVAQSLRR